MGWRPAWCRTWAAWLLTPAGKITFDQMLNCEHEMAPDVDKFTMDSPAPLIADANGRYRVPQPGIVTTREY